MQLKTVQQARQPLTQQFYNVQKEYDEGEQISEPYKRLVHQSEALDEMKELKEKMREGIVVSTPKPYQTRAKTLFQSLEAVLKFNERGEIYSDKNQLISNSRLEDLIQHAVRDRRRRSMSPTGWPEFRHLLKVHNVPKHTLNRDTLDEMKKEEIKEEPSTDIKSIHVSRKRKIKNDPDEDDEIKSSKQRVVRRRVPNPKYGEKFDFLQKY